MRKIIDKLLNRETGKINIKKIPSIDYTKEYWFPSPDLKNENRKNSIKNIFKIQSF